MQIIQRRENKGNRSYILLLYMQLYLGCSCMSKTKTQQWEDKVSFWKQDKCPTINFMRIYTFFVITFVHAFTRKLRPQAPEKFRPSGHIENSDPWRTQTLQVYQKLRPSGYISKTHTPEKFRPSRCIENSDPVILLNFLNKKVAHKA